MGKKKQNRVDKLKKKRALLISFWILFLAVYVIAAAPTTPTVVAPTNNSNFYNNANLTTSSTDPDSDDFNYIYWYVFNSTNQVNLTNSSSATYEQPNFDRVNHNEWEFHSGGGAPVFTLGTSDQNRYTASNPTDTFNMFIDSYTFNADDWWVYIEETAGGNVRIHVDDTSVLSLTSSALQWVKVDVSQFNDGSTHQLNFTSLGAGTTTSFWFPHAPFQWKAQACDVNNECSSNTSDQRLNFINFYRTTEGTNHALNFTFEQENNTGNKIDGRISSFNIQFTDSDDTNTNAITITGATENNSYAYGMYPINISLATSIELTYGATGYQDRTIATIPTINGSGTTNQILYLLGTDDGQFVTFQVVNVGGAPINAATVTASRVINGQTTLVSSGMTDANGAIVFWLDPSQPHIITASKSGEGSLEITITPSQTQYTLTLGSQTINETSALWGINYLVTPTDAILVNNTMYNFTFDINSSFWNLTNFGFNLVGSNGTVLNLTTNNSITGGVIFIGQDTANLTSIDMNYWWNIEGNYTNLTKSWMIKNTYEGDLSLKNFFDDLANFAGAGFDDFGRALISIVLIVGVIVWVTFQFGIYSATPIAALVFTMVLLLESVNFMPPFIRQYLLTVLIGVMFIGIAIQENSR